MSLEIERKFLVRNDSWKAGCRGSERLRQGYLSSDDATNKAVIRIRQAGERSFVTIKGRGGLTRPEFEYEIPLADAAILLRDLCLPTLIEKTRYEVDHAGMTWLVDEFAGAHSGLILAEIEIERPDQSIDLPSWVGEEVTENPIYRNSNLSAHPDSWRR